jgi:Domain of unknown function (DUF5655)
MNSWECPSCLRRFARTGQGHECAPAMSLETYFETGPSFERPIFEKVFRFVEALGPIFVEPVSVGIFLKKDGSWLELRPLTKWVALSFPLGRRIEHARIARKPMDLGTRILHVTNLKSADDVDTTVEAWLIESYSFGV